MIKKSMFADEIMLGMQQNLQAGLKKQASVDPSRVVDLLAQAVVLFTDLGMTKRADKILQVLEKLAQDRPTPSVKSLMEAGIKHQDLRELQAGNPLAKAKINNALRQLGYDEWALKNFLGKNYMTQEEADDLTDPERSFGKMWDWLKDPSSQEAPKELSMSSLMKAKPAPKTVEPGDTIELSSVINKKTNPDKAKPGDEFEISSLASFANKFEDKYTKGLTSEKMVKNLLDHGTEFNLSKDHKINSLKDKLNNPEYKQELALKILKDLEKYDHKKMDDEADHLNLDFEEQVKPEILTEELDFEDEI